MQRILNITAQAIHEEVKDQLMYLAPKNMVDLFSNINGTRKYEKNEIIELKSSNGGTVIWFKLSSGYAESYIL